MQRNLLIYIHVVSSKELTAGSPFTSRTELADNSCVSEVESFSHCTVVAISLPLLIDNGNLRSVTILKIYKNWCKCANISYEFAAEIGLLVLVHPCNRLISTVNFQRAPHDKE
jgi:hypothetical protein